MNKLKRGLVVMFDGPDGVGKSTQLEIAAAALKKQGYRVESLHVLGGTEISKALRAVLFSDIPRSPQTESHIALAIHYSLAERLKELSSRGVITLVDRSALSLLAYQVYGNQFDQKLGRELATEALKVDNADLIIVYEAPEKVLQDRRRKQQKAKDYFEKQDQAFHKRTIAGYKEAAKLYKATVIDASGDLASVHETTMQAIYKKIVPARDY